MYINSYLRRKLRATQARTARHEDPFNSGGGGARLSGCGLIVGWRRSRSTGAATACSWRRRALSEIARRPTQEKHFGRQVHGHHRVPARFLQAAARIRRERRREHTARRVRERRARRTGPTRTHRRRSHARLSARVSTNIRVRTCTVQTIRSNRFEQGSTRTSIVHGNIYTVQIRVHTISSGDVATFRLIAHRSLLNPKSAMRTCSSSVSITLVLLRFRWRTGSGVWECRKFMPSAISRASA